MKHIRLIRHGESAANAGAASRDHASIPLTENGMAQARQVAHSCTLAPELIVVSPYSRARQTAAATASRFTSTPIETWPVQEFTYLDPAKCVDTTVAQRRGWVEQYWSQAEPTYQDGEGAESFLAFVTRAQSCLDQLAAHAARDILVFSHGQFLNAVAWLIQRKPQQIDRHAMLDWRQYEMANPIANGCGYQLQGGTHWRLGPWLERDGTIHAAGIPNR